MKIIHCCLANFYADHYGYQENILPRQNKLDGHEVLIIASTETYRLKNERAYIKPQNYLNEDGIQVIRVPYRKLLTHFINRKFRSYQGIYNILEDENPDVILFHGTSAWELLNVARYKKHHPQVKFYTDSHADTHNSATGFISRHILHRLFYGTIARYASRSIDKILCISLETQDFLCDIYGISRDKMELYPLGGIVLEDGEYFEKRKKIRAKLGLKEDDILLLHSGKLKKRKRTADILNALSKVEAGNLKLVILGSILDDVRSTVEPLIQADNRVRHDGWKNNEELLEYLCAADMYIQPGGQSATMQNAICCRCPVMLYPHRSHEPYLKGNGYFVESVDDMANCFRRIADQPELLRQMSDCSLKIALELFDYRKLAARLYR